MTYGTRFVEYCCGYSLGLFAKGGGKFVEIRDWRSFADLVITLDMDRECLATRVLQANANSRPFDQRVAIRRQIDLIVTQLDEAKANRR